MIIQFRKRLEIDKKCILGWIIGIICGFCYFQPEFLSERVGIYYLLSNGLQLVFSVAVIVIFFVMIFRNCVKFIEYSHIVIWMGFSIVLLIPNIKEMNVSTVLFVLSNIAILCIFIVFRGFHISVLQGCAFYLSLLVYINALIVFLFPEGLYNVDLTRKFYFFGHANGTIKYIVPCIVLCAFADMLKKEKYSLNTIIVECVSVIVLFYIKTYTGVFGIIIVLVGQCVCIIRKRLPLIMTARTALISSFLLFSTITSSFFMRCINFVGNLLDRSYSISSRYVIWEQAKDAISHNVLMGYGHIIDYRKFLKIGYYYPSSAHNFFLDVMMNGGVIGIILVLIFLGISMNRIDAISNEKAKYQVVIGVWSILVMWNYEPWFSSFGLYSFMIIVAIANMVNLKESYGK